MKKPMMILAIIAVLSGIICAMVFANHTPKLPNTNKVKTLSEEISSMTSEKAIYAYQLTEIYNALSDVYEQIGLKANFTSYDNPITDIYLKHPQIQNITKNGIKIKYLTYNNGFNNIKGKEEINKYLKVFAGIEINTFTPPQNNLTVFLVVFIFKKGISLATCNNLISRVNNHGSTYGDGSSYCEKLKNGFISLLLSYTTVSAGFSYSNNTVYLSKISQE